MNSRIIALNLPAQAAQEIAGNPVSSRLESVVANCWPGLEADVRNLDRRFFPGLIFELSTDNGPVHDTSPNGARLIAIEPEDADMPGSPGFRKQLRDLGKLLQKEKVIFLSALTQNGKRIELHEKHKGKITWHDDIVVWRMIRSLKPGPVGIEMALREKGKEAFVMRLKANRRTYQKPDGSLPEIYRAGELSQSLCSPWQHDFRDCSCNYWAANHPDIAMPEYPATIGQRLAPGREADQAERPLMWMRRDREAQVRPPLTSAECREFEMDHYQLNEKWQDLAFVVERRESGPIYSLGTIEYAEPLPANQLKSELMELAGMEHALAIEFLYARYSVEFSEIEVPKTKQQSYAHLISHELLAIATSEMMHLRWVNQLLSGLWHAEKGTGFRPALGLAATLPSAPASPRDIATVDRVPQCRPLDQAIDDFIAAERNSGTVEGKYAKVFSLLQSGYPPELKELVSRIIADGVAHYSRFRRIQAILHFHKCAGRQPLVRQPFIELSLEKDHPEALQEIQSSYIRMLTGLHKGFRRGDSEDRYFIAEARMEMKKLDTLALQLAREGKGVPFLKIAQNAAATLP